VSGVESGFVAHTTTVLRYAREQKHDLIDFTGEWWYSSARALGGKKRASHGSVTEKRVVESRSGTCLGRDMLAKPRDSAIFQSCRMSWKQMLVMLITFVTSMLPGGPCP
jgi:hypothetical protein